MKPWAFVPCIKFHADKQLWTATARVPGHKRKHRRLSATNYPDILISYLAHSFDQESLLAAAKIAEAQEVMRNRINSLAYRRRTSSE